MVLYRTCSTYFLNRTTTWSYTLNRKNHGKKKCPHFSERLSSRFSQPFLNLGLI
jgi:hypothetical protein